MEASLTIPPFLEKEPLLASLEKFQNSKLDISSIKITTPNMQGSHLVSAVDTVQVTTVDKKIGEEKVFQLFVKYVTPDESRQQAYSGDIDNPYKEIVFFNDILPSLKEFCKAEGSNENVLEQFPHCFYAVDNEFQTVVLENLCFSGYEMNPADKDQDGDCVRFVLKRMAEFHAVSSYYLRQTIKEIVKRNPYMNFTFFSPAIKKMYNNSYTNIYRNGISVLDCPEHRSKFELLNKLTDRLFDYLDYISVPSSNSFFDAICLGDCWNNNMMFKYGADGKIDKLKFIDLQLNHYGSVFYDLAFYLLTSTDPTKWQDNLTDYLKDYYDQYNVTITKFKNVTSCGFTFEEFQHELYMRLPAGFIVMFQIISLRSLPSVHFPDPSEKLEVAGDVMDEFAAAVKKLATDDGLKEPFKARVLEAFNISELGIRALIDNKLI